ncbi:MAG: hypothetical protein IK081_05805 [Lachnospiraceae bacterium]|nr:hypothetical protein [Lachnospiraceae bacterium]
MLEDFICFIIKLVLIGIGLWVVGSVVLMIVFFVSVLRWQVHEVTPEDRANYAEYDILPELADTYERYGTNGIQDVVSQRETYAYPSLNDLCNAMPEVCAAAIRKTLSETEPHETKDIKGVKVKSYAIDLADLQIPVPDEDTPHRHDSISFYVFEYKNGEYRFVRQCY